VLHLEGGRRIYGWPIEWPTDPKNGHFVLEQVSWLDGDKETELLGVHQMLVDATEVFLVEFMENNKEYDCDKKEL